DLFFRMCPEDVYTRFFHHLRSLTLEMAEHLSSAGYDHEMAFVATAGEHEHEQVVASASYYVDASTGLADGAYMARPRWQRAGGGGWEGGGGGTGVERGAIEYARMHGVRGFPGDVLGENGAMMAVLRRADARVTVTRASGCYEVVQLFG